MVPGGKPAAFMAGRSVDDDVNQPFVCRVILLGIGIEEAVAASQHPLLVQPVAHGHVDAFGSGRLQVLILAGFPWVVGHDIFCRRLVVGNGHQRNHVVDIVQIARYRQVQPLPVVLSAYCIVVGGLGRQVLVS